MKKIAAGLCILLAAGMVTACGGKKTEQTTAAEAATTTAAEVTMAAEVATAAGTSSPTLESATALELSTETPEAVNEEVSADAEITTVSGEIKAVGMSSITIVTEGGEELSFLKEGTEVDVADGLQEGMFVTITYKNTEEGQAAAFITDAIEP